MILCSKGNVGPRDIANNYCRHYMKIAFGTKLIFIKRHHGTGKEKQRE